MRLIDAEALIKEVENLVAGGAETLKDYYENGSKSDENSWIGGVYDAWELICNAPLVFSCNACKNMGNERECVDCHDYSNYAHYDERPQGETNAEIFQQTFGIYATELWSMKEEDFLKWLNTERGNEE